MTLRMCKRLKAWMLIKEGKVLKLEDIKKDAQIRGIQGDEVVRIVQVEPIGENALTIYYKDSQGRLAEQMLFRSDEPRLELAQAGRPLGIRCTWGGIQTRLGSLPYLPSRSLRSYDGSSYFQRRAITAPNFSGLRIHASPSTTAFCIGG